MSERILALLNTLNEADLRLANVERAEKAAMDNLLGEELRMEIEALKEELEPAKEAVREEVSRIKKEISEAIKLHGASVKGDYFNAIYIKPKRRWNSDKLEGLFAANPDLNIDDYSTLGSPSAQIRTIKKFSMEK